MGLPLSSRRFRLLSCCPNDRCLIDRVDDEDQRDGSKFVARGKVRNRCITRCRGKLILCGTRTVVSVLAEKALSRAQVGLALRRLVKQSLTMKQVLSELKSGEAYVFPSSPIREQRPIFLGRTRVANLTIKRHGRQESQLSRDPGAIFAAVDQEASRGAHHSPLH